MTDGLDVVELELSSLMPHPRNEEIYGELHTDEAFLETFRRTGQLQPIIVTPDADGYTIIAGHRRVNAMIKLGWQTAKGIIKIYESEADQIFDFLASNAHRTKNMQAILRETIELLPSYQTVCQSSTDADSEAENDDSRMMRFSREKMTLEDIAGKIGMSDKFLDNVNCVFGEVYREKYFERIEKAGAKISKKNKADFIKQWDKVRAEVLKGNISVSEAAGMILEEKRKATGQQKVKAEKVKPAKVKKSYEEEVELSEQQRKDNALQFITEALESDQYGIVETEENDNFLVINKYSLADLINSYADTTF